MKKLLVPFLLACAAAGCTDANQPVAPRAAVSRPHAMIDPGSPDVATYWRAPDTLLAYDFHNEVGLTATPQNYALVANKYHMKLVRTTVYWDAGTVAETALDGQLAYARAAGVELEVVVHSTSNCKESHADPYGDFADFMYRMAVHYPDVRFWELWNEQDSDGWTNFFGGGGYFTVVNNVRQYRCVPGTLSKGQQGYNYAQMLKRAYPRIKSANPGAWVLMGGISAPDDSAFLNGVYRGGGKQYYDIANMHAYGVVTTQGQNFAATLARNGDVGRPIWLTEFGRGGKFVGDGLSGTTYDQDQNSWWQAVINDNASSRRFAKMIGYELENVDPNYEPRSVSSTALPLGPADFGAGILRSPTYADNPLYERPLSTYLVHRGELAAEPAGTHMVTIRLNTAGMVPDGYNYEVVADNVINIYGVHLDFRAPLLIHMVPGSTDYTPPPTCTPRSCPGGG